MIHTADKVYVAIGDYHNGASRFRAGEFVLITEPELIPVLEQDGGMALLQPLNRAAFLGKAAPVASSAVAAADEQAAQQAAQQAPEPEAAPDATEPNVTVAAGKPRGHNRMTSGAVSQSRKR